MESFLLRRPKTGQKWLKLLQKRLKMVKIALKRPKTGPEGQKKGSNYEFCGPTARFDDISPYILRLKPENYKSVHFNHFVPTACNCF